MNLLRRALALAVATALTLTAGVRPAFAARTDAASLPDTLTLPDGFPPGGITIGHRAYAYVGSRDDGDILEVNLRTGESAPLIAGTGTPAAGMRVDDRGRLFVAGGTGGDARVIDTGSGRLIRSYRLATGTAVVSDVVLTRAAAWFTDSVNPVLYELPLGAGGELPDRAVRVPLTIGYADGIAATPDGSQLLVVQSGTGRLYRVGPSGDSVQVDLGGESLRYGGGMVLRGRRLYVVQNLDNVITKIKMSQDLGRGAVQSRTKDARFDVPAGLAAWHGHFYLANTRPTTAYAVVRIAVP